MIDNDDVNGLVYLATIWISRVSILNKPELEHLEYRLRSMARHHDDDDAAALVRMADAAHFYLVNYDTAE